MILKLGLGDRFTRKLLHVKKKILEVRLITPNVVINMLAMRLCLCNKILKGDLSKIIEVQEENSFIESGIRKEGRKLHSNNKYWKEGWVDDLESKFKSGEIEVMNTRMLNLRKK